MKWFSEITAAFAVTFCVAVGFTIGRATASPEIVVVESPQAQTHMTIMVRNRDWEHTYLKVIDEVAEWALHIDSNGPVIEYTTIYDIEKKLVITQKEFSVIVHMTNTPEVTTFNNK